MASIFQSLLLVIAGSTQRELARHIKYLKVENEILRSKLPDRITITPKERQRLLKFGARLGKAIHQMVTIVTPSTFLRWVREDGKGGAGSAKRGRPRTPEDIRKLILRMARENSWGYSRIEGELRKLGIRSVTKSTIRNILKADGLDPGPKRGEGTWDQFIKQHAASLWQCDFFHQRVLTLKGLRHVFVLAFLNVETRRVILSPATEHPDEAWVLEQAETFVRGARNAGLPIRYLIHDNDTKFTRAVDQALRRRRIKVVRTAHCAPNMQAYVERFIQSLRTEVLEHFVIFGKQHLDHLLKEFLEHYHTERPHQGEGIDNELLVSTERTKHAVAPSVKNIHCTERLGGLLRSYSAKAA